MTRLWTTDVDGERWLINPQLIVAANPPHRRKVKKMASRKKRRMPAALARYWATHRRNSPRKHKRHYRRNWSVGPVVNRKRKKHYRHNPSLYRRARRYVKTAYRRAVSRRHRGYARNPKLLGFEMPAGMDVVAVGAGILVPPIATSYIMSWLPVQYQTSQPVYWAVKIVAVVAPSLIVRRFVSVRAGNMMLIGGAATLLLDIVRQFNLLPSGMSGMGLYTTPQRSLMGMGRYVNGMGAQVALGARQVRQSGTVNNPAYYGTPERLLPDNRF